MTPPTVFSVARNGGLAALVIEVIGNGDFGQTIWHTGDHVDRHLTTQDKGDALFLASRG